VSANGNVIEVTKAQNKIGSKLLRLAAGKRVIWLMDFLYD